MRTRFKTSKTLRVNYGPEGAEGGHVQKTPFRGVFGREPAPMGGLDGHNVQNRKRHL